MKQKYQSQQEKHLILKTAVENVGERQEVDSMAFCAAPHPTKMVKSSMFSTLFGLKQLAVLAVCQLPFLG